MKLNFNNILNKHQGRTALIIGHGKSLAQIHARLSDLKMINRVILFGVNEWYHFYKVIPHYWIMANNANSIKKIHHKINEYDSTLIYADSVDLTPRDFVNRILKVDYLPFDQRHVNGRPCCCDGCKHAIQGRLTIQQQFREYTKINKAYEGGGSAITHAISMSIMMGCKEIYYVGIDLDWDMGYAENDIDQKPTDAAIRETELVRDMTINDLKILQEGANLVGAKIYNCNYDSVYKDIQEKMI